MSYATIVQTAIEKATIKINDEEKRKFLAEYLEEKFMNQHNNLKRGLDCVIRAVDLDNKGKYERALKLYEKGVSYLVYYSEVEINKDSTKDLIREKCDMYMSRAGLIRKYLEEKRERRKNSFRNLCLGCIPCCQRNKQSS